MASTARASRTTRFLNLDLIARGELRRGIFKADGDFAKRLPSPGSVVVGSGISENGYVAQESDRVIGSCGRWPGCANNGVGSRRRWGWGWRGGRGRGGRGPRR